MLLADTWALPEKQTICSKNKKYCFQIIPKKLTSQLDYFKDKVDGKENSGGDKKVKKNLCRGIFSVRNNDGFLSKRWEINLVNEVSPVSALVSENGNYVVTFDNWHGVGYGNEVVAIYETTSGNLIWNLGLPDFLTDSDISELPTSTSSIWWGGNHFIDWDRSFLVLEISKNGKRRHETDAKFFQIRIDLRNGNMLDEKRDRLPTLRFLIEPSADQAAVAETEKLGDAAIHCIGSDPSRWLSTKELVGKVLSKVIPQYSPAAKAVRATGQAVIAIGVSPDGNVTCVEPISGHPLLRMSIVNALQKWQFQESEQSFFGAIVFSGAIALVNPDGSIVKEKE
jgi:hypothetical protein